MPAILSENLDMGAFFYEGEIKTILHFFTDVNTSGDGAVRAFFTI